MASLLHLQVHVILQLPLLNVILAVVLLLLQLFGQVLDLLQTGVRQQLEVIEEDLDDLLLTQGLFFLKFSLFQPNLVILDQLSF